MIKGSHHRIESIEKIKEKRKLQIFTEQTKEKMRVRKLGTKHKFGTLQKMKETGKRIALERFKLQPSKKAGQIITNACEYCGSIFTRPIKRKFCSSKCSNRFHKGSSGAFKKGNLTWNTGLVGYKKGHPCYHKEDTGTKISNAMMGRLCKEETKTKQSKSHKKWWSNPENAKLRFEQMGIKPNKTESFTDSLVQNARPTDFIYSGDGKIWIAGKNPDWFNKNGKKQVIEMLGNYWHSEMLTGRTKEQEEDYLKSHYAKYGYNCLIIWESELKNPDQVIEKIRNF